MNGRICGQNWIQYDQNCWNYWFRLRRGINIIEKHLSLEQLLYLIEKTFPIPGRFRHKLPSDVAELSRLLTSARSERESGYLNKPYLLSAYLHYFLPWNVFRLNRLFSFKIVSSVAANSFLVSDLSDEDAITDLGSGPLTFPIALWMAFPELHSIKLEFRCVDKSAAILEAGYKLFRVLSNGESTWKIKTIHDSIDAPVRGRSAKLTTAINVFNEVFTVNQNNLVQSAEKAAALLCKLGSDNGTILAAEPGNPQGGIFISALRTALLKKGKIPIVPCPHVELCPLPGIGPLPGKSPLPGTARGTKAKWCHFAFDTETAPMTLHKLSAAAGIPKERATFSFLLASGAELKRNHFKTALPSLQIRIVSDTFSVPFEKSGIGCYGCSERGMVLITGNHTQSNELSSGKLLNLPLPKNEQRDPKTGALIIPFIDHLF